MESGKDENEAMISVVVVLPALVIANNVEASGGEEAGLIVESPRHVTSVPCCIVKLSMSLDVEELSDSFPFNTVPSGKSDIHR